MGNSKCLLLLALALIIGSTGCQNSLLGGRFDTQTEKHASVPATQQPTSDAQGVYKWDGATNTYTWLDNVYPQGRSATGTTPSAAEVENERLQKRIAELEN